MNPTIFREFSVRGVANRDLSDDVVTVVGRAVGIFFKRNGVTALVLGRDVRRSSPRISHALIEGLLQVGIEVTDLGVVPTPVHNFATDFYRAGGGVMVTASHNPAAYNGLKIRDEHTLHGDDLRQIYHLAAQDQDQPLTKFKTSGRGQLLQTDPLPVYTEQIKKQAHFQHRSAAGKRLKVVVDGGNGTNGPLVSQLLRSLDMQVVELYCEPDGKFPNRDPDPTAPGALDQLSALVRMEKANLGLAYDGDGDRLVLVDEQGGRVLGDKTLMILARDILRRGPAKIVYEILCTQALADDIVAHGGEPVLTPSGYAFVHQAMLRLGAALGGELSGHLFFNEPNFRFDDAILATIKLLNIVSSCERPVSSIVAELPAYHSSPQVRIPCPDSLKSQIVERVRAAYETDYKVDTLDGARIHFENGWAMVRQSNTQPVISMRFEARSAEQLIAIQTEVQSFVETELRRQTSGYYEQ